MKKIVCAVILGVALAFCLNAAQSAQAATWAKWVTHVNGKPVQYSTYAPNQGGCGSITASGRRLTYQTKYVAVPIQYVVTKSTWKKHKSRRYRLTHFYYHEKIKIKRGKYSVVARVEDCGGFKGFGGSKYERLFDLAPAVHRALHVGQGVGVIKWTYLK